MFKITLHSKRLSCTDNHLGPKDDEIIYVSNKEDRDVMKN